jgi:DNA-binding LacI/PurR family transcriptional regulator
MPHGGRNTARFATLADVARQAGVSTTTASFVLNDRPVAVTDQTRQRVLSAARDLQYSGNAHIAALRRRRSLTLGVHLHDYRRGLFLQDPVTDRIMTGISEAARDRGYHLLLFTGIPEIGEEAPVGTFLDRRVDGLIYVHAPVGSRLMADLSRTRLPCVIVFNRHAPETLAMVDGDSEGGTRLALQHLLDLGHRRIAHLTRDIDSSNRVDRCAAYERFLRSQGLYDPRLVIVVPRGEDVAGGVRRLMELPAPPTALFCFNDDFAIKAMRAVAAIGLAVPKDVSVVGFDDINVAALVSPALTTVRQPLYEMGKVAAQALADLIDGTPATERRHEVPMELAVRESTAPPSSVLERPEP